MFDGPDDRVVIGPFRRRELADKPEPVKPGETLHVRI